MRYLPIALVALAVSCGGGGGGGSIGKDRNAPLFAGADSADAVNDDAVVLQWTSAVDDRDPAMLIVYNVYMATTPGGQNSSLPDATTGPGEIRFLVTGLNPGTPYFFVVRAMDLSGNEDDNTVERTATTLVSPDSQDPVFAGAGSALALSETEIQVDWVAGTDNVTPDFLLRYNLYAATLPGQQSFGSPDLTTAPGEVTAVLTGLLDSTPYHIVVRAVDYAGNEETNTVEVSDTTWTPDTTDPIFAGLITATSDNPTRIELGWAAASDDRTSLANMVYRIYWATSSGGQNFGVAQAVVQGVTQYTMGSLPTNTTYYIVVRAVDEAGNEDDNTVERSATTLVSFGGDILGILTGNCIACHGQTNPSEGLELWNYSMILGTAINEWSTQSTLMYRIAPGDSVASYLQHKIDGTHLAVFGSGLQMPRGAPPLSQADRDLVRLWIDQGARDN